MKNIKLHYIAFVMLLLVGAVSCKDDDESAAERTQRLLRSSWKADKVTGGGVDYTAAYANMTLTVADATYTVEHGAPLWPSSGTWKLVDASTVEREDGTLVTIGLLSESNLTLSFQSPQETYGPARAASVKGEYTFEFSRQ
jgi:hypothetical protein